MFGNQIEEMSKCIVVNLSWIQTVVAKFLLGLLDPVVAKRTVFQSVPNPPELKQLIYPSQLEQKFGGTAPNVTQYWPPIMPEMVEEKEDMSH